MTSAQFLQRIPRPMAVGSAVVLAFLIAIVWRSARDESAVDVRGNVAAAPTKSSASAAAPAGLPAGFDASAEMQQQRLALINKLIGQGVFQKIEKPRQVPYLWVRPGFYALDFDMKEKFSNVAYAYFRANDPAVQLVILYDSRTGKRAGTYSEANGGLALD